MVSQTGSLMSLASFGASAQDCKPANLPLTESVARKVVDCPLSLHSGLPATCMPETQRYSAAVHQSSTQQLLFFKHRVHLAALLARANAALSLAICH